MKMKHLHNVSLSVLKCRLPEEAKLASITHSHSVVLERKQRTFSTTQKNSLPSCAPCKMILQAQYQDE